MTYRKIIPVEEIVSRYRDGDSVKQLAEVYGIDRGGIVRRLRKSGVLLRNAGEQQLILSAKRSPEERMRLAKFAHDARRGQPRPVVEKVKSAQTRQKRAVPTELEAEIFSLLQSRGYTGVPQLAIWIFNADIGFPSLGAIVEADPGNWHSSPRKQRQDARKEDFLSILGWRTFRISRVLGKLRGLEETVAGLDLLGRDPAALSEQRMLWSYLQDLIAAGDYDEIPVKLTGRKSCHRAQAAEVCENQTADI